MDRFVITMGDFLKNAGIVGLYHMLDTAEAEKERDYGYTEDGQALWINAEYALQADWTSMYFQAFIKYFGPITTYQGILERIERCLRKMESGNWQPGKEEKEDIKYITSKLLSNSYQSGYENIKGRIEEPEVYINLKRNKCNEKTNPDELKQRLTELKTFLEQPLCKETLAMKSIAYTYINRFWDGKCFLLRANAKKDMKELFEKEFSLPLLNYWKGEHEKRKELCIDCGMPMSVKEKVSFAFLKDMADDLSRKRSAFWDCKVDAFLCPVCAFVYALSPLGFQLYANKLMFLQNNENVEILVKTNSKYNKQNFDEKEKQEKEKYSVWFARLLNSVLQEKTRELNNIQVILRGMRPEDAYQLQVIQKPALLAFQEKSVKAGLDWLGKHPFVKTGNDYLNVHEQAVMNIIQFRKQYGLLRRLMKELVENNAILPSAYWVYTIQVWTRVCKENLGEKERKGVAMSIRTMRDSGYALRKEILRAKDTDKDDCMRGTVYQLLNALSVKNEEKYMEIIVRLYSSSKLLIPDEFVYMLGNKERFQEYGYAFILGLKGSHSENRKEE